MPPPLVKQWIMEQLNPSPKPETVIMFDTGEKALYDWSGGLGLANLTDAGIFADGTWVKKPKKIIFGTKLNGIAEPYLFYGCDSLTDVRIPSSIEYLNDGTFQYCHSLSNVVIDDSVSLIGNDAFRACTSLSSITLPAAMNPEYIDGFYGNMFSDCSSLTSISINKTMEEMDMFQYQDRWGLGVRWNESTQQQELFEVVIHCSDGNLYVNRGWGPEAFTVIQLSDGTTERYQWTDISLENFRDAGYVSYNYGDFGYVIDQYDKFAESIKIGSQVSAIKACAFLQNGSLKHVQIPENCKIIENGAFNSSGITELSIRNDVSIIMTDRTGASGLFGNCNSLSSVHLPDTLTEIRAGDFSKTFSLAEITIPDSVSAIGDRAFSGSGIKHIHVPENVKLIGDMQDYASGAFEGCKSMSSITLEEGLLSIGNYTFNQCDSLMSVVIPDSVTNIGRCAFIGSNIPPSASNLESVVIGSGVSSIGQNAFQRCYKLSSVVFRGKTIEQVQAMANYPWSIPEVSAITVA